MLENTYDISSQIIYHYILIQTRRHEPMAPLGNLRVKVILDCCCKGKAGTVDQTEKKKTWASAILGVALSVSEAMPFVPHVQSNGILDAVVTKTKIT